MSKNCSEFDAIFPIENQGITEFKNIIVKLVTCSPRTKKEEKIIKKLLK